METSNQTTLKNKQEYRDYLRNYAKAMITEVSCLRWSTSIIKQIEEYPVFQKSTHIGVYMAMPDEPNLSNLLDKYQEDKQFYIPRVDSPTEIRFYPYSGLEGLERQGKYQLLEPTIKIEQAILPEKLELIIIPALAFDHSFFRLGRGKGYYDRYLPQTKAFLLGVCYPFIDIESLKSSLWDVPMHDVLRPVL